MGQTRRALLETVDRPALKPLPAEPYGLAEWRIRRVGIDYHVEVDNHFYSVPHRYARAEVDARFTTRTVEVFLRGERIATHRRGSGDGKHTTLPDHMPSSHRRYADWTIERIGREAVAARAIEIGALTYGSVKSILDNKLNQVAAEPRSTEHQPLRHRNIRGGGYFH